MLRVISIDPGNESCGFVLMEGLENKPIDKGNLGKKEMIAWLKNQQHIDVLLIEMVENYGMRVGSDVFETLHFIGYLHAEAKRHGIPEILLIGRKAVKHFHCNNTGANDSDVRNSLTVKYGLPGVKKSPGYTYGITKHAWQAFALATYYLESLELRQQIKLSYKPIY